jgi:DNA-binding NarL/FixJ family response regulator
LGVAASKQRRDNRVKTKRLSGGGRHLPPPLFSWALNHSAAVLADQMLSPSAPDPEQQRIRELFRRLAEVSDPVELKELKAELRHLLTARALVQKPNPRELRLIEMVALGLKNREIAERLGITEQVVKNYLHKIYVKIRVENRTRLALWYEEHVYQGKLRRQLT